MRIYLSHTRADPGFDEDQPDWFIVSPNHPAVREQVVDRQLRIGRQVVQVDINPGSVSIRRLSPKEEQ